MGNSSRLLAVGCGTIALLRILFHEHVNFQFNFFVFFSPTPVRRVRSLVHFGNN